MKLRCAVDAFVIGCFLVSAGSPAIAQGYPDRPIRIVVPYAPGGATDLLARLLQEPLRKSLGRPIIIENKSGAAGAIGTRDVAHSAPDGYSLLIANSGIGLVPLLQKDAGFDFRKDFAPVAIIGRTPIVIIANGNLPVKDLAGLIEYGKRDKNGLLFGSAGVGSLGHLSGALFAKMSGVTLEQAPYRSQTQTVMAVVSGEVPIAFTSSSDAMLGLAKDGRLKILGIGVTEPSPLIPGGVPISRTLPGYSVALWQGILAPAGTPTSVIAKLNDAVAEALASPEIQQKYERATYSVVSTTPAQFSEEIASEYARWSTIIREQNIRAE